MIVSVMVQLDDGSLFTMARAVFDERVGYDRRSLFKLYKQCRAELTTKIKKLNELEAKDEVE